MPISYDACPSPPYNNEDLALATAYLINYELSLPSPADHFDSTASRWFIRINKRTWRRVVDAVVLLSIITEGSTMSIWLFATLVTIDSSMAIAYSRRWQNLTNIAIVVFNAICPSILGVTLLKPLTFLSLYPTLNNALSAYFHTLPTVLRMEVILLSVILIFSVVAHHLYGGYDGFRSQQETFITLFTLSTTVNNPSSWQTIYHEDWKSALFFVTFLLTTVFFLNILILSITFGAFQKVMKKQVTAQEAYRETSLQMASKYRCDLMSCVRLMRPHYGEAKIETIRRRVVGRFGAAGSEDRGEWEAMIVHALGVRVRTRRRKFGWTWLRIARTTRTVMPAVEGVLLLLVWALYVFSFVGMSLLGGVVDGDSLTPVGCEHYGEYNFNTLFRASVTNFQLLAVNDWHNIASVFVGEADKVVGGWVTVYVYFGGFYLLVTLGVLNLVVCFFLEAFGRTFEAGDGDEEVDDDEGEHDGDNDGDEDSVAPLKTTYKVVKRVRQHSLIADVVL